jgi:hypothetical protein
LREQKTQSNGHFDVSSIQTMRGSAADKWFVRSSVWILFGTRAEAISDMDSGDYAASGRYRSPDRYDSPIISGDANCL